MKLVNMVKKNRLIFWWKIGIYFAWHCVYWFVIKLDYWFRSLFSIPKAADFLDLLDNRAFRSRQWLQIDIELLLKSKWFAMYTEKHTDRQNWMPSYSNQSINVPLGFYLFQTLFMHIKARLSAFQQMYGFEVVKTKVRNRWYRRKELQLGSSIY